MLAGQPIAASIGYGTKAKLVTPFSMDLNGNAITVSNAVTPVMLSPGRFCRSTRPTFSGSSPLVKTIGMVEVAALAARIAVL